jgi:hypothetical protein
LFLELIKVLRNLLSILDAIHQLQDAHPSDVNELNITFVQIMAVCRVGKVLKDFINLTVQWAYPII